MQAVARLSRHQGVVEAVAFSPDSARLVTACSDGMLRLWTVPEGQCLAERLAHKGGSAGVAFGRLASPGPWVVISGGRDCQVRLWRGDLSSELKALAGHKGSVDVVAVSADGKRIASGSQDRTARVWDAQTGRELAVLGGHADRVSHLAFSPNGKVLATAGGDERCVRLWDVAGKTETRSALPHGGNVHGVAFHRDGRLLAVPPQRDGGVVIWDLVTGQRVDVPQGQAVWAWAVAFAPDGQRVAAGDFGFLKVWRVQRNSR
jgi:WD40 repeat protein